MTTTQAEPDVVIRIEGRAGRITLNRPKALNALSYPMVGAIWAALTAWRDDPDVELVILDGAGERALCAGGDVRAMYDSRTEGSGFARRFWREEYRLNALIGRYPKPYVALMDGVVMGGGIGLSSHGSHRIVTERSALAMPETTIGLIPDVGGTWLLAHAPGRMGEYLGLLGERMLAGDAIYAGFADTHVPSARLGELVARLVDPKGEPIGVTVAGFAAAPNATVLAGRQGDIDRIFAAPDVAGITAGLAAADPAWAREAGEALAVRSPLALVLTLEAVRRARKLASLEAALDIEYRLTSRLFEHGEFIEGVRALLIDKDRNPRWSAKAAAEVSVAQIEAFFAPLAGGEPLGLDGPA